MMIYYGFAPFSKHQTIFLALLFSGLDTVLALAESLSPFSYGHVDPQQCTWKAQDFWALEVGYSFSSVVKKRKKERKKEKQ